MRSSALKKRSITRFTGRHKTGVYQIRDFILICTYGVEDTDLELLLNKKRKHRPYETVT